MELIVAAACVTLVAIVACLAMWRVAASAAGTSEKHCQRLEKLTMEWSAKAMAVAECEVRRLTIEMDKEVALAAGHLAPAKPEPARRSRPASEPEPDMRVSMRNGPLNQVG